MLLKTVQPLEILNQFRARKPVIKPIVERRSLFNPRETWGFSQAYEYMKSQMSSLGQPPNHTAFWAWEYSSPQNKIKADEMIEGQIKNYFDECCIITFEKPDNEVLLSDAHLWDYPINYFALPANPKEQKMWEQYEIEYPELNYYENKPLKNEEWHEYLVSTWDKCFKLKKNKKTGNYVYDLPPTFLKLMGLKKEDCLVQATFWDFKTADIKDLGIARSRF